LVREEWVETEEVGRLAPEETRDVINGLMQDIVGSALMSGQMAAAGKVSLKAITKLINASKLLKSDKSKVMEHAGLMGKEEKDRVFNSLTVNAEVTKTETKRGDVYKAGIEGGGVLASRDFSSGLPPAGNRPTLEIRIPGQPPIKIRF
jgi:hypothetical protein